MSKSEKDDWSQVFDLFPEKEEQIRQLAKDPDFKELCDHFVWVGKAGLIHPNPLRAEEYQELARNLEEEIRSYLYPDQTAGDRDKED